MTMPEPTTPAPTPQPTTPKPNPCTGMDADRFGPDLGGCCNSLEECIELRAVDDAAYCAASDPGHGSTCWSNVIMCRDRCPTRAPGLCSGLGSDRHFPDLGGCCNGLEECIEPRPADLDSYCAVSNPRHGSSCWSTIHMCRNQCSPLIVDPTGGKVRLLTFNVWYGNTNYDAIADLIRDQVDPDIVNLQEAVNHQPDAIVAALNAKGNGQWSLANPFGTEHFWCGLNVYRSDKWDLEWRREIGRIQGDRGMCGARLRRKSDGRKMCVWGTHPIWRQGGPARYAQEAVRAAAEAMRECSSAGAASALLCDCNTGDANAVRDQLESSTGWQWAKAHTDGYDHVYVETAPQSAGAISGATTIAPHSGARGCQRNCQNPEWAYADHPPVFVDVDLR